MKKLITTIFVLCMALCAFAQNTNALDEVKANPRKAFGNDFPYDFPNIELTKTPKGYKPFYISHYARHGSRYYWNDQLYKNLDTLLTIAHDQKALSQAGEEFYNNFVEAKAELMTGISELTELGWQQHQGIARNMYNHFPEVFKDGGNVLAISSLEGRCVISMAAFCQELTQCNPALEVREQSSRFYLHGVVPTDKQNPYYKEFPKMKARYEKNPVKITPAGGNLNQAIIERVFATTEGLPYNPMRLASSLKSLYTSLPNIGHEGMMGNIITDEEIAAQWETSNLGSYSWVFTSQNDMIPILEDIVDQAQLVIDGKSDLKASLRFGHDSCIGPLTVLMGLNGANLDPEDPYEVKNVYQNWQTCKACNIQLIFYRSKKAGEDILVKCLLNESEAKLPVETDMFPYYKWNDVRDYYLNRCKNY